MNSAWLTGLSVELTVLPLGLLILSAWYCFPSAVPETSQLTAAQRSSSQGSLGNSTPDIPPRPSTRPWSMVHSHDLLSSHNHSNSDVAGSPRYDSSFGKFFPLVLCPHTTVETYHLGPFLQLFQEEQTKRFVTFQLRRQKNIVLLHNFAALPGEKYSSVISVTIIFLA